MSSTQDQSGFYSTPAFEIFRRGLTVQTVKKFRGLNAYLPLTQLTPDVASDLLNVIVTSSGQLSKLRIPIPLSSPIAGQGNGPYSFWDFQQGNGVRQVLAHFGSAIYSFDPAFVTPTLIENNGINAPPWSFVEANNILFGANGNRMQKWTGTAWQQWGINTPATTPTVGTIAQTGAVNILNAPPPHGITNAGQTVSEVIVTANPNVSLGQSVIIAGNSNGVFNGTWVAASPSQPLGPNFFFWVTIPGVTGFQTGDGGTALPVVNPTVGWSWAYAYKNSVTGHVSSISPVSPASIPAAGFAAQITAAAPTDPQVDTLVWFRTLDGGGDYFRQCEVTLATGAIAFANGGPETAAQVGGAGPFIVLNDNGTPDSTLDQTTRGPVINNPPPQGTYLTVAQGRIFVAGLVGGQQVVAYSGYEQILIGRPEESFPPNNRLLLSIGAEAVAGLGTLHSGVVMFSSTGKMWMLRGQMEDITLSTPIIFTQFFEEMPWTLGCLSHYTIQSTPYGLVWLAGDKTVQFWSGQSAPIDISEPIYPLLRSITPGTEKLCAGSFFNWLERDWYALTCATGGSASPNTIFFFSMEADSQQIDIFTVTLPANWIGVQSTPSLQRRLLISNGGIISEIPVRATDINGITNDFTTYPPTSGVLRAYWRSGYFGNDQPEQSKMWRWSRMVTDGGTPSYQHQFRFVDDTNLIQAPAILGPVPAQTMRTPMNQRGYRASVEIDFPEADASMNVLELQVAFIGTSQR